jgi:hypothetical protein
MIDRNEFHSYTFAFIISTSLYPDVISIGHRRLGEGASGSSEWGRCFELGKARKGASATTHSPYTFLHNHHVTHPGMSAMREA